MPAAISLFRKRRWWTRCSHQENKEDSAGPLSYHFDGNRIWHITNKMAKWRKFFDKKITGKSKNSPAPSNSSVQGRLQSDTWNLLGMQISPDHQNTVIVQRVMLWQQTQVISGGSSAIGRATSVNYLSKPNKPGYVS
jgi:hypothetical protein